MTRVTSTRWDKNWLVIALTLLQTAAVCLHESENSKCRQDYIKLLCTVYRNTKHIKAHLKCEFLTLDEKLLMVTFLPSRTMRDLSVSLMVPLQLFGTSSVSRTAKRKREIDLEFWYLQLNSDLKHSTNLILWCIAQLAPIHQEICHNTQPEPDLFPSCRRPFVLILHNILSLT